MEFKKGDIYGTHRVISPKGVLPQPADVVDNTMEIYNNEVLIDVHTLNIDSASFTEISNRANGDVEEIKRIILEIVNTTGKHKNPWTGSGGMLIGRVAEVGPDYEGELKKGDNELSSAYDKAFKSALNVTVDTMKYMQERQQLFRGEKTIM